MATQDIIQNLSRTLTMGTPAEIENAVAWVGERHRHDMPMDLHGLTRQGETLLGVACRTGCLPMVHALLAQGARVNDGGRVNAPLGTACYWGHLGIATALLLAGASPNPPAGLRESTPLHLAATGGRADVIALLLHHGASPEVLDAQGQTPLQRAQSPAVVQVLVAHELAHLRAAIGTATVPTSDPSGASEPSVRPRRRL